MRRLIRCAVVGKLILLIVGVSAAGADPVRITDGFLSLGSQSFGVDFGFEITPGSPFAFVGEGLGNDPRYLDVAICSTCSPPQTRPTIRVTFSPSEVFDHSSNSLCPGCGYAGDLIFTVAASPVPAAVPFTMTGTLAGFAPGSSAMTIQMQLVGSGNMSASSDFVLFQFEDAAPVPEPGTMALAGLGLAGIVRTLRRRAGARQRVSE
jgi:PEP-CTERM motif-containing protein